MIFLIPSTCPATNSCKSSPPGWAGPRQGPQWWSSAQLVRRTPLQSRRNRTRRRGCPWGSRRAARRARGPQGPTGARSRSWSTAGRGRGRGPAARWGRGPQRPAGRPRRRGTARRTFGRTGTTRRSTAGCPWRFHSWAWNGQTQNLDHYYCFMGVVAEYYVLCFCVSSGGLTLIVGTKKRRFSCNVQRRHPADMFLNESLPPKTPCGHPVHGRHGHGSPVKNRWRFSKFYLKKEKKNFEPHFKNLYLARTCHGFEELTLVLFESLF